MSPGDIGHQTRVTLNNIRIILEACGASLGDVVKCSVFLKDASEFKKMNEVYAEFFPQNRPARTTIEAKFHNAEMLVEIDCVAYKPHHEPTFSGVLD
jgi:2-iminobutanoate/2-iminopropanoate deaminase